jgi:hypothetical protein
VQTDTDGDGIGDLCDACPLISQDDGACQPVFVSSLKAKLGGRGQLLWRGEVDLGGVSPTTARALLVNSTGVVLDASMAGSLAANGRLPGHMRYRSDAGKITLKRRHGGTYRIRVAVRGVSLDPAGTPLISASLRVGETVFADSLSCSRPRGRKLRCRG